MRKRALIIGGMFVLALAFCVTAYAGDGAGTCAVSESWHGFWNSVGGFLYNALPWNWGNWAGK